MDLDVVDGLTNLKSDTNASSPVRKHEVSSDGPPFWIDIPRLPTPEREKYQYTRVVVDDEEPLEVVYDVKRDGETWYYARMRSGLYKKVTILYSTPLDLVELTLLSVLEGLLPGGRGQLC